MGSSVALLLLTSWLVTAVTAADFLPVVIWHGMGDSCCNPFSMGRIKSFIEEQHNGTYVYSIMIGSNVLADTENGFFMNVNDQITEACDKIRADPKLAGGYHGLGFSQGGQFFRGLAQRCPQPPIKSLVSVGGPQQGVFGLPPCPPDASAICEYIRKWLHTAAYASWIQDHLVQAEYWHDPLNEETYKEKNVYLADINQETVTNATYRANLMSLDNLVLVKFNQDTVVIPRESEWFGFYTPGQDTELQTLQQSTLYTEDRLGLKALDEAGKLHFIATDGDHLQFSDEWFLDNIVNPYFV